MGTHGICSGPMSFFLSDVENISISFQSWCGYIMSASTDHRCMPTHLVFFSFVYLINMARRRSGPSLSQRRSASTMAAPTRAAPPPPAPATRPAAVAPPAPAPAPATATPSQGPGLFAQMASTAAGVAVGSAVGHTIGAGITSMFGGGSSHEPAPAPEQPAPQPYTAQQTNYARPVTSCDADARAFTDCLQKNNGDINACQFYLDMLRQCQQFQASLN
jgi:hypothetical protein